MHRFNRCPNCGALPSRPCADWCIEEAQAFIRERDAWEQKQKEKTA